MSDIIHPLAGGLQAQRFRDYTRQRQYGTGDILLDNRIIFFGCSGSNVFKPIINDLTANLVIQQMLYLQYENRNQEIHFYINSPGGSVTSTLAIYDTMQFLECPVVTYCMGLAASGAAILLTAGSKGKRYILPNAKVMIHQPWSQGMSGQASDVEIEMMEMMRVKKQLNDILVKHTGQSLAAVEDRDGTQQVLHRRGSQGVRPRGRGADRRCSRRRRAPVDQRPRLSRRETRHAGEGLHSFAGVGLSAGRDGPPFSPASRSGE